MFAKNHFVETWHKVGIEESAMEDRQTQAPPNELEIAQMIRIDARCWVDLEGVVVVRRVFE